MDEHFPCRACRGELELDADLALAICERCRCEKSEAELRLASAGILVAEATRLQHCADLRHKRLQRAADDLRHTALVAAGWFQSPALLAAVNKYDAARRAAL